METSNSINNLGLLVADHISAMLAYWDKDLLCRFANESYIDWFGKSRAEMVNKMTLKELLGPLYDKNLPYINAVLKGESQTFEREIVTPGGELRYSLANYIPDIVNNEVRGFFVHVADVTPLKLLEKKLEKSNEIIVEQNKRLMNFANVISHNLKNYANGFSGIVDLLIHADSDEAKIELLKLLNSISAKFNDTIENLNEVVHAQNSREIKLEPIDLGEYISKALSILSFQINSTNTIIYNKVNSNTFILGNPAYVESVLTNVFSNAIKYKHPERTPVIEVNCALGDSFIELTISDNGLGIDLEKFGKKLFEMYCSFHGNSDAEGIGLYITKFQIEAMKGKICVESKVNVGSKFKLYFKKV